MYIYTYLLNINTNYSFPKIQTPSKKLKWGHQITVQGYRSPYAYALNGPILPKDTAQAETSGRGEAQPSHVTHHESNIFLTICPHNSETRVPKIKPVRIELRYSGLAPLTPPGASRIPTPIEAMGP